MITIKMTMMIMMLETMMLVDHRLYSSFKSENLKNNNATFYHHHHQQHQQYYEELKQTKILINAIQ